MIDKIVRTASGQDGNWVLGKLAILSVPFLLMIIGALLGGQLNDIKSAISVGQTERALMQRQLDVQEQIIQGNVGANVDQETRLRALENWQRVVNSQR